jgi:3-phosphoshikimate 1-carboxyvinyltransferase
MNKVVELTDYSGKIVAPSSKSDAQRAMIIAFLCTEKSIIHNLGESKDELAVLKAIQVLGGKINPISEKTIEITGVNELSESKTINLNESGLGIRILTSICSLFSKEVTILGEGSLKLRPMDFFNETLTQFNVKVESNNGFTPLIIKGPIQGKEIEIDASLSSQFLSGLLITLPFSKSNSILHVKNLNSFPYLNMTLNSLEKFGIEIKNKDFRTFEIKGNQKAVATNYFIEGDWSAASFWLVAAALGKKISVSNLNLNSFQADKAILDILKHANCIDNVELEGISLNGKKRTNINVDLTHSPDLFPILAIYAALTKGENKLIGTNRLIHKESNRGISIQKEFRKLGVNVILNNNEMIIYGSETIQGGLIDSHNDHRIAMAFAILGMFTVSEIIIQNPSCVDKSYPNFWLDLDKLKKPTQI